MAMISPGRGSRVSLAEGLPACGSCVQNQDALAASASRRSAIGKGIVARERSECAFLYSSSPVEEEVLIAALSGSRRLQSSRWYGYFQ